MIIFLARVLEAGHRRHVAFLLAGVVACMLVGAEAFSVTQHIPFTTGVYWAITTATTVGYGDVTPHNPSGRFVASAVMLTSIPLLACTFALITGQVAVAGLRKVLDMKSEFPAGSYRLLVGWHPTVPTILDELIRADESVVLVADVEPTTIRHEVHFVRGDPTSPAVLKRARPAGAVHALVTGASDGDVLVSSVLLREQAPDLTVSALVHSLAVSEALRELGIAETMPADELLAHTLAKSLETPHAGRFLLELVTSEDHRLIEIDPSPSEVGQPLSQVRDDHRGLVLGLLHAGRASIGIGDDPVIDSGDKLLVVAPLEGKNLEGKEPRAGK